MEERGSKSGVVCNVGWGGWTKKKQFTGKLLKNLQIDLWLFEKGRTLGEG